MPLSDRDLKQPGLQEGVSNMFNAIKRSQEKVTLAHKFHIDSYDIIYYCWVKRVSLRRDQAYGFWRQFLAVVFVTDFTTSSPKRGFSPVWPSLWLFKTNLTWTVYDRSHKSESLKWFFTSVVKHLVFESFKVCKLYSWEGFSPVWPRFSLSGTVVKDVIGPVWWSISFFRQDW